MGACNITDGDYYAANTDVQKLFNNSNLAASGGNKLSADAADAGLALIFYMLNLELGISAKPSNTTILGVLKKISLDLIAQQIKTIENLRLMESGSADINTFYTLSMQFTNDHKRLIRLIKRQLNTQNFAYDMNTGVKLL